MSREEGKEIDISFFLKELLTGEVMSYILDAARMSNMGDRQFKQFERSVKDHIYKMIRNSNDVLVTYTNFKTSPTADVLPRLSSKSENNS